ncbi:hypothetical protein N792_13040 [Lysobacter concretionis Ko07 = DSM 16239]|uniref:Uncharacterized protein n=1 Tax=Lysobacter concretionis Ko07 = DSM 16239 TaxID=1122185 RepID=A0A0A0EL15_9GAMM|nr:hypothetical protein N792_13040 [Lysobacter concretionis Ko07 = DSM 16239]
MRFCRTASIRANCKVATISLAALVSRLLLMIEVKLGVAIAIRIAATATVTINSTKVKPRALEAICRCLTGAAGLRASCIVPSPG